MKKILLSLAMTVMAMTASAALTVKQSGGWNESAWMEFNGLSESYSIYNGYVSADNGSTWNKLDGELVRSYGTYGRVDALGLKAGNYKLKVVPVKDNAEVTADAVVSSALSVKAYDRGGFAHFNWTKGVGAYNNDGTLKTGAKVLYVTAKTAKTVTMDVQTDTKGTKTKLTGLQAIVTGYQKGCETTPLAVRFIGTIDADDMDGFDSSAEGLQVKGRAADSELNITFEGIGNDAFIYGFGFLVRNSKSVEFRNFGVATLMDDDISLDTDNSNIWVHNIDAFYGKQGSGDHAKGDGAIDVKSDSKYVTVSYCHFWDTGKSTMCGMTSESGPNYITYHHNWFDHSDSRHARIRTMSVHMYNNLFDGNAKYCVGATTGSSVFVEANYFKNCPKPMLISKQGTDVHNGVGTKDETKGTFSGEEGGIIKAFANAFSGAKTLSYYSSSNTQHFDAYEAKTREEQVPSSVKTLLGGNSYNNFDTNASLMYSYAVDAAADVPSIVTGEYGAGRIQHGDLQFTFTDADNSDHSINPALRAAIDNYKSAFVKIIGTVTEEKPDPTDTRAESVFKLVSDASVALNQGEDATISVTDAAGVVSYTSGNTGIATVDATGKISAVGAGKTMITISDPGSETVKGKTITVSVTVLGSIITDGDVVIKAGDLPSGYELDESASMPLYEYNAWTKTEELFLVPVGQHTITLPEGVKVTEAVLYAVCDNNTANKGKITELAGKTFAVDLHGRKDGVASEAKVTDLSITNELTFTVTYKSGVKIALKVAEHTGISELNAIKIDGKPESLKLITPDGKVLIVKDGKVLNAAGAQMK